MSADLRDLSPLILKQHKHHKPHPALPYPATWNHPVFCATASTWMQNLTASTFLCGSLRTQMGRETPNPPGTSRAGISTACFAVFKQTRSCCWAVCELSMAQSSQSSVPRASLPAWGEEPSWGQQTQLRAGTSGQAQEGSRENQESTRATEV